VRRRGEQRPASAKVSGRIERMARETLARRQFRLLHPSKPWLNVRSWGKRKSISGG
jgi:hypothetical protein